MIFKIVKKYLPGLNVLSCSLLLGITSNIFSDIIHLKDGGKVEGIIVNETSEKIVVSVSVGEMEFDTSEVAKIERSDKNERKEIEAGWEEAHKKNETLHKETQKAYKARPKQKKYELKEVVLLTASWCGPCKRAIALFKESKIPHRAYDIEKTEKGMKMYKKLGGGGIPIIFIGNRMIRGCNVSAINAALKTKEAWKLKKR
jgi:glutaredoxin